MSVGISKRRTLCFRRLWCGEAGLVESRCKLDLWHRATPGTYSRAAGGAGIWTNFTGREASTPNAVQRQRTDTDGRRRLLLGVLCLRRPNKIPVPVPVTAGENVGTEEGRNF